MPRSYEVDVKGTLAQPLFAAFLWQLALTTARFFHVISFFNYHVASAVCMSMKEREQERGEREREKERDKVMKSDKKSFPFPPSSLRHRELAGLLGMSNPDRTTDWSLNTQEKLKYKLKERQKRDERQWKQTEKGRNVDLWNKVNFVLRRFVPYYSTGQTTRPYFCLLSFSFGPPSFSANLALIQLLHFYALLTLSTRITHNDANIPLLLTPAPTTPRSYAFFARVSLYILSISTTDEAIQVTGVRKRRSKRGYYWKCQWRIIFTASTTL